MGEGDEGCRRARRQRPGEGTQAHVGPAPHTQRTLTHRETPVETEEGPRLLGSPRILQSEN